MNISNESQTSRPPTPRWVKVFAFALALIVVVVIVMMFVGDNRHGPSRHMPTQQQGVQKP